MCCPKRAVYSYLLPRGGCLMYDTSGGGSPVCGGLSVGGVTLSVSDPLGASRPSAPRRSIILFSLSFLFVGNFGVTFIYFLLRIFTALNLDKGNMSCSSWTSAFPHLCVACIV